MQWNRDLPVLLVAYKRPELARQAIQAIRRVRPSRLYFAVDGPRPDDREEARVVNRVRALATEIIDWDCEVRTLFRDENRGCALGVSEAISWFFDQERTGVILEEDCIPDPAFFNYARELLERYADDPRIMHISGNTRVRIEESATSYFFSGYPQVWGWATWRDAWRKFQMQHDDFESKLTRVLNRFDTDQERAYWEPVLRDTFSGKRDSWAYRWAFTQWLEDGLSTYPTSNMVENIGFGSDATHTGLFSETRWLQPAATDPGDLRHPESVTRRADLDQEVFDRAYSKHPLPTRLFRIARSATLSRFGHSQTG